MANHRSISEEAREYRRRFKGVIGVESKIPIRDASVLSRIYTPGVAEPCLVIERNPITSYDYTFRGNTVALVTDGSAVFGLGNVGPEAALPVMEGKSVIFKTFAGIDAFPICLKTQDAFEIIDTLINLAPTFGAVCLEDIVSPKMLTIASHLRKAMNIPVLSNHEDGVAVGVVAGLINALKVVGKEFKGLRVVINGAGAAGYGTVHLLQEFGVEEIVVCDHVGALYRYRPENMNWAKWELARNTNPAQRKGQLEEMLKGADVYIGFSSGSTVTPAMVKSMAKDPIVFAFSIPTPEIRPEDAREAGAAVIATGRTDYPNQMDVASVFPGVLRGALDVQARDINMAMLIAAAKALANIVTDEELRPDYIIPDILDFRVAPEVARAVAEVAIKTGEARVHLDPDDIAERARRYVYEGHLPVAPRQARLPGEEISIAQEALELHNRYRGKLQITSKIPIKDNHILRMFYLPPQAVEPAAEIYANPELVYSYTAKGNLVAIVTDGSAVLGLGNIGARAALPVMEGKAVLFHTFAGVEAFPICLSTQEPDQIVEIVKALEPTFGGVNLEDISAPRCFYIEARLRAETDIPIFHDDQHGTAVVVLAALINAMKLTGKKPNELKIVVNGAGAAGVAVTKLLLTHGVADVILCDTHGAIYKGRKSGMNWIKEEMAEVTNLSRQKGNLADVMKGTDVFVGLSAAGAVSQEMVRSMAPNPIIYALANPTPEIMPDLAREAGAAIIATGRSDFENQVNNSLAFPGIFRGALDVRAVNINDAMKIAAAYAIAGLVEDKELNPGHIIPSGMDFRVPPKVAAAVAQAAMDTGEARLQIDPQVIEENTRNFIYEGFLGGAEEMFKQSPIVLPRLDSQVPIIPS